jgi:hypothetical protein
VAFLSFTKSADDIRREFGTPVPAPASNPSADDIRSKYGVPGGKSWTFTQLTGDKKTLSLQGYAAPFGRPRKDPVATTPFEVREYERHYPGSDIPTRHIFGMRWDDIELHGRWMDSAGGRDFARQKVREIESFINDQRKCRIVWGDTLSFVGLLKRIETAWESPAQVAWKLTIKVDSNDSLKPTVGPVPEPKAPGGIMNQMLDAMSDVTTQSLRTPPILKPSLLDFLDNLISLIAAPSAVLLSISQSVDSFKTATFSELARFRAVMQQYRQAIQQFRTTYESAKIEAAIEFARADEELQFYRQQSFFGATMASALKQIVEADKAAARAQRSSIKAFIQAKEGDSWDTISVRGYGSADRANDVREANGIAAGVNPQPGAEYILPT